MLMVKQKQMTVISMMEDLLRNFDSVQVVREGNPRKSAEYRATGTIVSWPSDGSECTMISYGSGSTLRTAIKRLVAQGKLDLR